MRPGVAAVIALLLCSGSVQSQKLVPLDEEFQVNSYTTGNQKFPEVSAADQNGRFVVVWDADYGSSGDTWRGVQARRMSLRGVFFDSFESSDFSAWSKTVR